MGILGGPVVEIVNTNVGPNYNWKDKVVSRYAPFATNDTPETSVKIIGGRRVIVENSNNNSVARKNTPTRLTPVQGKTEDIYHMGANISKESDANKSQRFMPTNVSETQNLLNPHHLIPPIPRNTNQNNASDRLDDIIMNQSNMSARGLKPLGVECHPLDTDMLPDRPVQLSLSEEAELRQRVADDLKGLSTQVLKTVYLELTAFDPQLTGYVHFKDLTFTLLRNQVHLSTCNQRLLGSFFLSESETNKVHYEHFLYFLSSSMKRNRKSDFTPGQEVNFSGSQFQKPLTVAREPVSHHDNLSNNSNRVDTHTTGPTRKTNDNKRTIYDTPELLRIVEEQLRERNARHPDIDCVWDMFRQADRNCSQVLSRRQIKTLAIQCRLKLDEDILDQVIDRCHEDNDRYWWEKFLNLIGSFLVHKTGLSIPVRSPRGLNRAEGHANGYVSKEDRLAAVEKIEKELLKLATTIHMTRQKFKKMKETPTPAEPWLKRFMLLAHAMYEYDEKRTGYLTAVVAEWLTREYSRGLDLGLTDETIQTAIRQSKDFVTKAVAIEHLLRTLVSLG